MFEWGLHVPSTGRCEEREEEGRGSIIGQDRDR